MTTHTLSRRGFLTRSLAALVAAGMPAWYARELLAEEQAKTARKIGANDRIRFGIIGAGDRFGGIRKSAEGKPQPNQLLSDMLRHKQNWEIVAVCDVDRGRREQTAWCIAGGDDAKAKDIAKYNDFRELCARKDIDAVVIVTPDHWHTIPAICAAKSGKDIYLEKPMTLTVAEGQALVKAVRGNNRILQVGSQQRSDARFRLACELVRNGRIGTVKAIETRIGGAPKGGPFKTAPVPEGLDWSFWLGQTPMVEYIPQRCHYEFRWWYEYSGGKTTDWGAHHNDIAQWGLGADGTGPISVESQGEADTRPNCYNCHHRFVITYQYGNGVTLKCMSDGENGVLFTGDKGWIFVSRGKIRGGFEPGKEDRKILDEPLGKDATRLYVSNDHMGNFFECLRSRKDPICNVDVGHSSVVVCHIGNISLRLGGKKLSWSPDKQQFKEAEGNQMLSRQMRAPWSLEI
jgi:predicted dehydrogenase